jgi:hypothetical protein
LAVAVIVFSCLLAALSWCLITGSAASCWFLVVASALWLPANNRHLEGRTLVVLTTTHGITVSDLVALGCWLLATATLLWRAHRSRLAGGAARVGTLLATCAGVFLLGALVAVGTS